METRTNDGLAIKLYVAFQYQLTKESLAKLYIMYNVFYETIFIKIAREVLLAQAGIFQAAQYWVRDILILLIYRRTEQK